MNNKKHDEDFFRTVYGDEELEKIKKSGKVNIPSEYSIKPPKKLKFEVDKINNEKSTLNERMQLENRMIKFETKKLKNMETFEDLFIDFKPENSEKDFRRIASSLMANFVIKINSHEYLLTEIEFYCQTIGKDSIHHDPYVHGDDLQKQMSHWYFHGSGLDLTFGNDLYYGGILIRGIKTKSGGELKYISGPLNVVKELFSKANKVDEQSIFCLKFKSEVPPLLNEPFFVRRVGLNEKHNKVYFNKKYRAIVDISSKHPFKEKEKVYKTLKEDSSININLEELFGYKIK